MHDFFRIGLKPEEQRKLRAQEIKHAVVSVKGGEVFITPRTRDEQKEAHIIYVKNYSIQNSRIRLPWPSISTTVFCRSFLIDKFQHVASSISFEQEFIVIQFKTIHCIRFISVAELSRRPILGTSIAKSNRTRKQS